MKFSSLGTSVLLIVLIALPVLLMPPSLAIRRPPPDEVSVIDAFWGRPGMEIDAGPGDRSLPLTIVIANTRKETLLSLVGELRFDRAPFTSVDGESSEYAYNSAPMRSGEIAYLTFEVNVNPDARPGRYTLDVLLSYQYVNQRGDVESESKFDSVVVYLEQDPGKPEVVEVSWSGGYPPELGAAGRLVVSMRLPEPMAISDVVAELRLPPGLETPSGSSVARSVLSRITGTLITLTFDLVSRTAIDSSRVTMNLTYTLEWGTRRSYTHSIDVPLRGSVRLAFEVVPRELVAGTTNLLSLRVFNYGTEEVSQLLITVSSSPSSQLVVLTPSTIWLEVVRPGEAIESKDAVAVYVSPGAPSGAYGLSLTAEYFDRTGIKRVRTETLGLVISKPEEFVFQITVEGEVFRIGQISDLRVVIRNVSDKPVRNIVTSVTASPSLAVMGGSDRQRIPSLNPGETVALVFRLASSPNAQEGVHGVSLTLSYDDVYGRRLSEVREIGVLLKGVVRLRVLNVETVPGLGAEGSSLVVAGELLNEGNVGVRNVWVEATGEDVLSASNTFLGDVAPGEKKSFSIDLSLRGGRTSGEAVIRVLYEDRFGDRNVLEQSVRVEATPNSLPVQTVTTPVTGRLTQSSGMILLFGAALLSAILISVVVARRIRRHGRG